MSGFKRLPVNSGQWKPSVAQPQSAVAAADAMEGGARFVDRETLDVKDLPLVTSAAAPDLVMRYNRSEDFFVNPLDMNCYDQEDVRQKGGFLMASMPGQLAFAARWVYGIAVIALFIMTWIVYGDDKCDTEVRYTQRYIEKIGHPDDDDLAPIGLDPDNSTEFINIALTFACALTILVGFHLFTVVAHALVTWMIQSQLKMDESLVGNSDKYQQLKEMDYFSGFFHGLWSSFATQVWKQDLHVFVHLSAMISIPVIGFLLYFILGNQDLYGSLLIMALAFATELAGFAMNHSNQITDEHNGNTHIRPIRWMAYFVRVFGFTVVGVILTIWICRYPHGQLRAYLLASFCVYIILWGLMVVYQFIYYFTRDRDVLEWMFEMYKAYEPYRLGQRNVSELGFFNWIVYLFYVATHSWTFVPFYHKVQDFIASANVGRSEPDVANVHELAEFSRMHTNPFWYDFLHVLIDLALWAVIVNLLIWPICDENYAPRWLTV